MNYSVNAQDYKQYILNYLSDYHGITDFRKNFHCLNPDHTDNDPSMSFYSKNNTCRCFGCGAKYDIFDLIQLDFGLDDFKEQLNKVMEIYEGKSLPVPKVKIGEKEFVPHDYTNYFKYCLNNQDQSDYLEKRGISKKLQKKYHIGYDSKNKRVVFPINKFCYFARGTEDKAKIKSPGISYLWNEELLLNSDNSDLIYITEGIIDALSLEMVKENIKVVSLNGLDNYSRLIHLLSDKEDNPVIILVFDDDYKGQQYEEKVYNELKQMNIKVFKSHFTGLYGKDVNDALLENEKSLKDVLDYHDMAVRTLINELNQKESGYEI